RPGADEPRGRRGRVPARAPRDLDPRHRRGGGGTARRARARGRRARLPPAPRPRGPRRRRPHGPPRGDRLMDVFEAIRGRRTHKAFDAERVPRAELEELFDLARFAPNHHLTQPWRFRVLGPDTLARLKEAAGPAEAPKLDRAPTLVVASARLTGAQQQDEEDVCATAAAVYAVLLGAHAR